MTRRLLAITALLALAGALWAQTGKLSPSGEVLRVLMTDVSLDDISFNRDKFPILDALEKATGVKLAIEAVRTSNYTDVLQTRLSSGNALPDMILVGGGFDIVKLGKAGLIIPLQDLIAKNAPEMVALMKTYPDIKGAITDPAGTIWGWPARVSEWDAEFSQWGPGFRLDWVKKLGLSEPVSIASWETMLTAFKTRDPNGNGQADEIPFGGELIHVKLAFPQAFNLSSWSNWWSADGQGRVGYDFTGSNSTNAKAWLTTMNRWYRMGLFDSELLVSHDDKAEAQLLQNRVGATGRWNPAWDEYNVQMRPSVPGVQWITAVPATGPGGLGGVAERYPAVNRDRFIITRAAKNPALAVKWLNYMFATDAGQRLFNYGVQDLTYSLVDGRPVLKDIIVKNPSRPNPSLALAAFGADRFPVFVLRDAFAQQMSSIPKASLDRLATFKTRTFFPEPTMTPEEAAAYNAPMADIQTYVDEMIAQFIVGTEPLSGYDKFTAKISSMGIAQATKIKQTLYDRFNAK